ncbi:unnamed protein product, partial [Sphacelaria rigidula]
TLFRREHAYSLFFSGGVGGRVSDSFALWDHQDAEWVELTADQAKVHASRRAEVVDAVDAVRVLRNRRRASAAIADSRLPGVPNFPVGPDSDSDDNSNRLVRPSALAPALSIDSNSDSVSADLTIPDHRHSPLTPTFRTGPGTSDDGTD